MTNALAILVLSLMAYPANGILTLPYRGTTSIDGQAFWVSNTYEGAGMSYGGFFSAAGEEGEGVFGQSIGSSGIGVKGWAAKDGDVQNYGGHFCATGGRGIGVYGWAENTGDVENYGGCFYALGKRGIGVYAMGGPDGYAGYFEGRVHVQGNLTKSSGSFKIDHPLDPENKYLQHSFVESPDMMNVYNGNVVLDKDGEASVQLPEYFDTLNGDFRYQLTCIGGFAPIYISEEISNNRFKIAGGKRGTKVSWQVTGIRQDAYANAHRIVVEEKKSAEERGYYLHPAAYGLPEEKGIKTVHNPQLSPTHKVAKRQVNYDLEKLFEMVYSK